MERVVFGLHTGAAKKWVTEKEANSIKSFFGLKPSEPLEDEMSLYSQGITKLWIEEVRGKVKPRFYVHVKVNFARILGISNLTIMPLTASNMRKAIAAVTAILKKLLSNGNEQFSDWTVERLDSAFDVYEEHTALLMQLLNFSLDLSSSRKKCRLIPIPGKQPEDTIFQSMRFGNDSYIYNIYVKLTQLLNEGKALTDAELAEVQQLLRVERQNHENALKKLLPNGKVGDLATAKVRESILKTMIDDIQLFFGTGDFYSWKGIKEQFSDRTTEVTPIISAMKRITANSLDNERAAYTKDVAEIFSKLGIAPAGIQKQLARQYSVDYMDGLYTRIISQYPRPADKRQYNSFPIPHKGADGRYRATVTLYWANREKQKLSVAGRTIEEYEMKVSRHLRDVYLINRRFKSGNTDALDKSFASILRFRKMAKTKEVKTELDEILETFSFEREEYQLTKQEDE